MEENSTNKQSEVAFTDFKSSVSLLEFEAVLELANNEYAKLEKVSNSKEKFDRRSKESLGQIKGQAGNMPPGLLERLVDGLERRANEEVFKQFENEIRRHVSVTDFLNRFRHTENQLEYLDFRTPKQQKKDGNI